MAWELNKSLYKRVEKIDTHNWPAVLHSEYSLLDKDMKVLFIGSNQVCLGKMPNYLKAYPSTQFITLSVSPHWETKKLFCRDEVVYYLGAASAANAFIVKGLSGEDILERGVTISLDDPMCTEDRIYVANTMMRITHEHAELVRIVIDLVKQSIPFWAAYYFAAANAQKYTNHNFLLVGSGPYADQSSRLSLDAVRELCEFFANDKVAKSSMRQFVSENRGWQVGAFVQPKAKGRVVKKTAQLVYPQINEFLAASTPEAMDTIHKEILEASHA